MTAPARRAWGIGERPYDDASAVIAIRKIYSNEAHSKHNTRGDSWTGMRSAVDATVVAALDSESPLGSANNSIGIGLESVPCA
jgi:hypothetical protein